jgi:hypothetical protein
MVEKFSLVAQTGAQTCRKKRVAQRDKAAQIVVTTLWRKTPSQRAAELLEDQLQRETTKCI